MAAIDVDIKTYKKSIDIQFHQLSYTTPGKEGLKILQDISGKFVSGKFTAILGPSGAGKTTLLNVLSGFKTKGVEGIILANGAIREENDFRNKSSYISQEFPMLGKLTTLETLKTAADLKLSRKISIVVKQKIISDITQILRLDKCLSTRVEKLSGGERKRLSIGVELITNPPVMFFDEPTSGLDSVSCLQVVTHLRDLAHSGRTVICVIHQPSSHILELFDDLYVLSNGQCIYSGAVDGIISTFQEAGYECPQYYNRADFALEVASQERDGNVNALIESHRNKFTSYFDNSEGSLEEFTYVFSSSKTPGHKQKPVQKAQKLVYAVSKWNQFLILSKRSLLCTYRDFVSIRKNNIIWEGGQVTHQSHYLDYLIQVSMGLTQINNFLKKLKRFSETQNFSLCKKLASKLTQKYFAQLRVITHIIIGLLLGFVFFDIGSDASKVLTNISCLFFFILFIFFGNSMPTALSYPSEASVFLREHLNNWYSLGAYFSSKIIADLPLQIICPTFFILSGYFLSGQANEEDRFLMIWFICLLTAVSAQAMGLLAGAAFCVQMAIFLIPASCIPMLVFSGFFIRFNELHYIFQPLTYISLFRYSFEGSIQSIYGFNRGNLTCPEPYCFFKNAEKVLKTMDMTENTFYWDILGLITFIIVFQIGVYIALKIRLRKSQ